MGFQSVWVVIPPKGVVHALTHGKQATSDYFGLSLGTKIPVAKSVDDVG